MKCFLLVFGILSAGTAVAMEPVANNAGASPRLKYLPKDYWFVGEVDLAAVTRFVNSETARHNPQYAQYKQSVETLKLCTGIDPEKDIDWITFFAAGAPTEDPKFLVVFQGSFNKALVENRLSVMMQDSISKRSYKRHTVYSISDFDFCFPEPKTIVGGDPALVREALDRVGTRPQALPKSLKGVLERTPGNSVFWAAVRPQFILDQPEFALWGLDNAKLLHALKQIDSLSISFDLGHDGLVIKALGYVTEPGGAKSLHQYLTDQKRNLLHTEGSNVVFTALLIFSELDTSGPYVEGSFRLTGRAFKELWDTKVIVRPSGGGAASR
jgi:hypothetical protein